MVAPIVGQCKQECGTLTSCRLDHIVSCHMSAHIELDFNADGTVTMTYRKSKNSDPVTETSDSAYSGFIRVHGRDDDVITNVIIITGRGAATEDALRRYSEKLP